MSAYWGLVGNKGIYYIPILFRTDPSKFGSDVWSSLFCRGVCIQDLPSVRTKTHIGHTVATEVRHRSPNA